MTVYVDNAFIRARVGNIVDRWCHLTADTEEELHAFAAKIGLKREWYQDRGKYWHYDVTVRRRMQAVAEGAVEVHARELARWLAYGRSHPLQPMLLPDDRA